MSNILFSSDHHFFHKNIILFCNRGFSSVEEMNEILIQNWNNTVKPNDEVYYLGDFAFCQPDNACKILKSLNGKKYLIEGNHDRRLLKDSNFRSCFEWIDKLAGIEIYKQNIVLCHYPMKRWDQSHRGAWHLFGHEHGKLPDDPYSLSIDVGVDAHKYTPISFEQVKELMEEKRVWE